jgi:hypothetical protein
MTNGLRVRHGINGFAHIAALYVMYDNFGWLPAIALFFAIRPIFDVALNLFRGLPVDYVTPKPKSIIDKLEQKAFGKNGLAPKAIYLITSLSINIYLWSSGQIN